MGATQQELLEARWEWALRDVERWQAKDGGVYFDTANSKRYYRIDHTLEELAALLVLETSLDEQDTLPDVTQAIWGDIRTRLLAWAEQVEQKRAQRRAA